jgi:hypothetical protein
MMDAFLVARPSSFVQSDTRSSTSSPCRLSHAAVGLVTNSHFGLELAGGRDEVFDMDKEQNQWTRCGRT